MSERSSLFAGRVRHTAAPGLPPGGVEGPRRRILEAALTLFARRGFHGTSVRDLADVLEQQPSALYKHFPSKEHVLAALVQHGYAMHHQTLLDGLLTVGASPVDQLHILVEVNARSHAQWPLLAIVVHEELHALPEALLGPVVALRDASAALLLRILQRGSAEGCFDVVDLPTTAAAIGAMGVRIPLWFHPGLGLDIDTMAHRQALLALRMVGATTSSKASR